MLICCLYENEKRKKEKINYTTASGCSAIKGYKLT